MNSFENPSASVAGSFSSETSSGVVNGKERIGYDREGRNDVSRRVISVPHFRASAQFKRVATLIAVATMVSVIGFNILNTPASAADSLNTGNYQSEMLSDGHTHEDHEHHDVITQSSIIPEIQVDLIDQTILADPTPVVESVVENSPAVETASLPAAPDVIVGSEAELQGKIILTIDDCSHFESTLSMFETLKQSGVRSVFFPNTDALRNLQSVYGDQVVDLWREMHKSGLVDIGYHTTDHEGNKTIPELEADLAEFETFMREFLGDPEYKVDVVRPPFGTWDYNWLDWSAQNHLPTIKWNGSSGNTVEYLKAILLRPDGGGITILHTRYADAEWLKANLQAIIDMVGGDNIVTFSDVYDLDAVPSVASADQ